VLKITALGSWGKHREKETLKGNLRCLSPRWVAEGNIERRRPYNVIYGANHRTEQLGKHRERDPKGSTTVLITALGSWGKHREKETLNDRLRY
jgi:hypothetical protein